MKLMKLMNNTMLSVFLVLALFSSASLADATACAKASSKSTYDWTGIYIGGFVGGASGANATSSTNGNLSFGDPNPAYSASGSSNYSMSSSFMGGGTVGYNWQIPKTSYLIGLEGEYGYLGQSGGSQTNFIGYRFGDSVSYNTQNKTTIGSNFGYGLVGGRLGYALDRALFYVKSGAVFTQVRSTNSSTPVHIGDPTPFNSNTTNSGGTTTGYALGGGLEYAPNWYSNKNLTLKVEYLYFGIPTSSNSSGSSAYCEGTCFPISQETYHNSTGGISTAKVGVNYKF
jgi:outer membrane immunogenic protein